MNTVMSARKNIAACIAACVACVAALMLACPLFASQAYADNIELDAPVTVSDDVTRLQVNKLDSDTHDYVVGATMAIIDEETGEVIDSWVTGSATHENAKLLDVGVTYILRELSAPDGYEAIQDVRFVVNETEGEGITILSSGDDAELTESYKVALYDKPLPAETVTTVTKEREKSTSSSSSASESTSSSATKTITETPDSAAGKTTTSTTVAPKTGDETPLSLVAALMGIGVSAILILQVFKRRMED